MYPRDQPSKFLMWLEILDLLWRYNWAKPISQLKVIIMVDTSYHHFQSYIFLKVTSEGPYPYYTGFFWMKILESCNSQ